MMHLPTEMARLRIPCFTDAGPRLLLVPYARNRQIIISVDGPVDIKREHARSIG